MDAAFWCYLPDRMRSWGWVRMWVDWSVRVCVPRRAEDRTFFL